MPTVIERVIAREIHHNAWELIGIRGQELTGEKLSVTREKRT